MKGIKEVKFRDYDCIVVQKGFYRNKMPALQLLDKENNNPIATATVFILGYTPETPKHTLIKNYSENEGILNCLIEHGIVEDTGKSVKSGFVTCPIVKILI